MIVLSSWDVVDGLVHRVLRTTGSSCLVDDDATPTNRLIYEATRSSRWVWPPTWMVMETAAERTYVSSKRGDLDGVRGSPDLAHLRLASPPSLGNVRLVKPVAVRSSPSVTTRSCSMQRRSPTLSRSSPNSGSVWPISCQRALRKRPTSRPRVSARWCPQHSRCTSPRGSLPIRALGGARLYRDLSEHDGRMVGSNPLPAVELGTATSLSAAPQ